MNVVSVWIDYVRGDVGLSLSAGIREMNQALGTKIRNGRVYEWRDGKHPIPPNVLRYMVGQTIRSSMYESGVGPAALSRVDFEELVDMLTPPERV